MATPDSMTEYDRSPPTTPEEFQERMAGFIGMLEKEADERVRKRYPIEQRWLEDLRQYHGSYEDQLVKDLQEEDRSTVFMNKTRSKTNACEARLQDMLFPTDDRNWGIQPTPVPELTVEAERTAREMSEAMQKAAEASNEPEGTRNLAMVRATNAEKRAQEVQAKLELARERARSMEEEIEDQLRECGYSLQARDVIKDGCRLGTGIIKGPVAGGKARRAWALQSTESTDEQGNPVQTQEFALDQKDDPRPAAWRTDPWNFFPDMDARTMDESDSVMERHLLTRKGMRKLARQKGIDDNAIRELLKENPRASSPTYIADLRSMVGGNTDTTTERYHVWEYHGPIDGEDLEVVATAMGRPELLEDAGITEDGSPDPLLELNVVIWFCQGRLLKFGLHYLDSGESIYSVFNLEEDDSSVFGFGIPYLMRDTQSVYNAAWRMLMDNAGLGAGPQIVILKDMVEPVDGSWKLHARKMWEKSPSAPPHAKPFETYDIPIHQAELANIIEMTDHTIDEVTSMPVLAQGEQGSHTTQTAHGMSLLMNSVNVVFRRIVKNWDDGVTTPMIRRWYDWNMQFSEKEDIKGDYEVDARGTSVLLVKEMQTANLMAFLTQFSGHPVLGKYLKDEGVKGLRRLAQTMMLPAAELVKTDEDIKTDEAMAAREPPPIDPEMEKLANELNITRMRLDGEVQIAEMKRETAMMELAAKHNITLDDLRARLDMKKLETQSKERIFAAEAAMESRMAEQGGGGGSGGYLSGGGKPQEEARG